MPGIPFLSAGGESLLRFDIPDLKLHFLGRVLWIEGGATRLGDREITIPPRSRRAGKLLARRPGGAADRVVLVASAPGFVARREVTFP